MITKKEAIDFARRMYDDDYEEMHEQMGDGPSTILKYPVEEQKENEFDLLIEYINQPTTLDSDVEEAFKYLYKVGGKKENSGMIKIDNVINVTDKLRTAFSDMQKEIALLTKSHEDVVIKCAEKTETLDKVREIAKNMKTISGGISGYDLIQQLLKEETK